MLSQSVEDYLKTIYKVQSDGYAATSEIARIMKVSAASVTNMLKRLAQMGLVEYSSYQGARLSEGGLKVALEILRHHRLLELYLMEIMGYTWDQVHEEAEHLEHHISEQFEDRIAELLGHPTHDPHGDPIPSRDGTLPETSAESLWETSSGQHVVVRRVSDNDPALLRYLAEIGVMPRVTIEVLSRAPFNGPITLRVGDSEVAVGEEVASNVFVTMLEEERP